MSSDITMNDVITATTVAIISLIMTSVKSTRDVSKSVLGVKSLMFAVLTCCMAVVTSSQGSTQPPVRVADKLFNVSTVLFDRQVTCSNSSNGNFVFPAETWSCYNLRVDDEWVRTCHPSGAGATTHCNDTDGKNDLGALCQHLLKAHGINHKLRAALIMSDDACKTRPSATVDDVRRRVVLQATGDSFQWNMYEAGESGCLQTLRCMLAD